MHAHYFANRCSSITFHQHVWPIDKLEQAELVSNSTMPKQPDVLNILAKPINKMADYVPLHVLKVF
jgi:hypothetical protein